MISFCSLFHYFLKTEKYINIYLNKHLKRHKGTFPKMCMFHNVYTNEKFYNCMNCFNYVSCSEPIY